MANIKLTNSVKIASESLIFGIDPSNVLANQQNLTGAHSYTATQDCYVITRCGGSYAYIDNVTFANHDKVIDTMVFPLRKGQKFGVTNTGSNMNFWYKVYGCK